MDRFFYFEVLKTQTPKETKPHFFQNISPKETLFPGNLPLGRQFKHSILLLSSSRLVNRLYIYTPVTWNAKYQHMNKHLETDPNNRSIYIHAKQCFHLLYQLEQPEIEETKCLARGSFPGKRVFFGG